MNQKWNVCIIWDQSNNRIQTIKLDLLLSAKQDMQNVEQYECLVLFVQVLGNVVIKE